MTLDLEALRLIAKAATPGEWQWRAIPPGVCGPDGCICNTVSTRGSAQQLMDAAYIAAFDPPTVLALLDRIRALESGE
jgi:hypothetical protein